MVVKFWSRGLRQAENLYLSAIRKLKVLTPGHTHLLLFIHSQAPGHGMGLPTLRVGPYFN